MRHRRAAAWLGLTLISAAPSPTAQGVHRFYAVAISPDGSRVATIESGQAVTGGEPTSPQLLIRTTEGERVIAVKLPCGREAGCRAFSPVWAPDGAHLAFGLAMPGTTARAIYLTDPEGGTPQRILSFDGTLVALRYGGDGRLAALATEGAAKEVGAARAGAVETGAIGTVVREQRIGIVADGALHWASPPELFVHEYDWLPDGSGFVGTAAPGDGDANWWRSKLYRFDPAGSARLIYTPPNPRQQIAQPKVSPDGTSVSFIGGLMSDYENPGGDAFVLPLDRPGDGASNLTDGLPATVATLRWGCAPGHLLASLIHGGETQLVDIDRAAPHPRQIWAERAVINGADTAVSLDCRTPTTATIRESFTEPPEIRIGPLGAWHALTAANAGITAPIQVRAVDWTSDGHDVQGWLLTPTGADATRKLPLVTVVHGGPAAAHQPYFFGPGFPRALVEHGYAVFLPNPRGSYGQGEAFTAANVRDFGHGDLRDILAGLDAVLRTASIDENRLGIYGASYGGYMTMWATTQTSRFKAAVARAGISNWQSYYGENGISDWLLPYFGASVYVDPAIYARSSPIGFVTAARTPTFLAVGERDIECPPPQSQEFWHALRELGTPTGLVVYPKEGHDYWEAGSTADFQARGLAWFDRYVR